MNWGKYTYGIYLLHFICLLFFKNIFDVLRIQLDMESLNYKENIIAAFVVGILSSILGFWLAKFSYTYYEKPFLKLKNKFSMV